MLIFIIFQNIKKFHLYKNDIDIDWLIDDIKNNEKCLLGLEDIFISRYKDLFSAKIKNFLIDF